jgi:hypothetical protein
MDEKSVGGLVVVTSLHKKNIYGILWTPQKINNNNNFNFNFNFNSNFNQ